MDNKNDPQGQDALLQSEQNKTSEEVKRNPSDVLTPDHPRFKEVIEERNELRESLGALKQELEDVKAQIATRQETTNSQQLTGEEQAALDRITEGLKARGVFLTADEVRVREREQNLSRLQEKYPGEDGLPKFDATDIVSYAKRNGFGENYEAAYKDLHFQAIVQRESKKLSTQTQVPSSEKAEGRDRNAPESELTNDAIGAMSLAEYANKRQEIQASIKASLNK